MEQQILTADDLKCSVCDQLPFEVFETEWCGLLVCQNCNTIKKCPAEWGRKPKGIKLYENRFLQKIINNLICKCEFCDVDVTRAKLKAHCEGWAKNKSNLLYYFKL